MATASWPYIWMISRTLGWSQVIMRPEAHWLVLQWLTPTVRFINPQTVKTITPHEWTHAWASSIPQKTNPEPHTQKSSWQLGPSQDVQLECVFCITECWFELGWRKCSFYSCVCVCVHMHVGECMSAVEQADQKTKCFHGLSTPRPKCILDYSLSAVFPFLHPSHPSPVPPANHAVRTAAYHLCETLPKSFSI